MELAVLDKSGKDTGRKVTLPSDVFGIEPSDHAIYMDVKYHLANKRQGTHKSKEKSEIKGSTRKIKKQKGTGTARAGSIKSGIFRGGARMFGPRPRNYEFKLNKKLRKLARKSALSYKATENSITVIDQISLDKPKTKEYLGILKSLTADQLKSLVVVSDSNKELLLSSRNLKNSQVISAKDLNTYVVLHADKLIIDESSVSAIKELLA